MLKLTVVSLFSINVQDHVNKVFFHLQGVRDYIHVVDLAKGHIAALKKLKDNCGCKVHLRGKKTKNS